MHFLFIQNLSIKNYCTLTEYRETFRSGSHEKFGIRALQTGSKGAHPVMFLIETKLKRSETNRNTDGNDDDIHLYTGEFSKCRNVILNGLISHYADRINDIHVDNMAAGLRQPCLLTQACSQIKQIVR